ncbi:MAG TPA: thiamine-phosphate kinase, partial [Candidatus Dormibacteraeota bacterium]|nr:thiamine-phosphate kinase [Candidatus Dormibacteraeota bacterium]
MRRGGPCRPPRPPRRSGRHQPRGRRVQPARGGAVTLTRPRFGHLLRRRFDDGGQTLAEAGEGALLDLLVAAGAPGAGAAWAAVVVGSGDDAAALRVPEGEVVVATQDAVVEDVDFRREWTLPAAVGSKALAVALSDVAAMGARPLCCTATVCAAPATRVDDLLAIQAGLRLRGDKAGCPLVGGDVSEIAGPLVVDVAAIGTAPAGSLLRRSAGRPGQVLVVTGALGRAAAGLEVLRGAPVTRSLRSDRWVALQNHGRARLREGVALAGAGVRCAGDLSDGLLVDAGRTARASGCGAELWLDALPVDAELREAFPDSWADLAAGGGEDFELLAAVDEAAAGDLLGRWPRGLAPLTVVGRLVEGSGVRVLESATSNREATLRLPRSRHFA